PAPKATTATTSCSTTAATTAAPARATPTATSASTSIACGRCGRRASCRRLCTRTPITSLGTAVISRSNPHTPAAPARPQPKPPYMSAPSDSTPQAARSQHAGGKRTDEQRAVALGNIDEPLALARLRALPAEDDDDLPEDFAGYPPGHPDLNPVDDGVDADPE